jgi:hypothetical protein
MTTTAILKLTTPEGRPFDLMLDQTSTEEEVMAVLKNAGKLGNWLVGKGCRFADAQPSQAALGEQRALTGGGLPTFAGFPCSPILDADGFPTWVMDGDKRAVLHKKNGDNWYSFGVAQDAAGKTTKWGKACLTIKSGQTKPQVVGLPVAG